MRGDYMLGHADRSMRPVIYLDVDGTILRHPEGESHTWWLANPGGGPANMVREFLEWARANCDVRWLTAWAPRGVMGAEGEAKLAKCLRVPAELLQGFENPLPWFGEYDSKVAAINWDEHFNGRPWVWIEDEMIERERVAMTARGCMSHFILTESSKDPNALRDAWLETEARFTRQCGLTA